MVEINRKRWKIRWKIKWKIRWVDRNKWEMGFNLEFFIDGR